MKLTLGLYGVFLLMVAMNGNSAAFAAGLKTDMPHFLPWLIVAAVLGGLYDNAETHSFAVAFMLLVMLGFTLSNYGNLEAQAKSIYSTMTTTAKVTIGNIGLTSPSGVAL